MSEREQLEQAIEALEAQRSILGSAVVDTALGPMREKLAILAAGHDPDDAQRKLVTVLFADVAGSTLIGRQLADPEDIKEVMDGALERMAVPVRRHGGHVTRFMGDGLMAVFGLHAAHEDDAEQAVRAGLDILAVVRAYAQELETRRSIHGFDARVGINTGSVATGGFSEGGDTLMGLAVNLAARMESAAPAGRALISHDTYRHVRGIFDVEALEPVSAKGFPERVPVYLVNRAKPRAFRMGTRGVEGIETRMVGREAELLALQSAYADAMDAGETRLVTVLGEAGVGKSRLLYEFENWMELRPEEIYYFKGRAAPSSQGVPYGVVRDMFAYRFDILDSDSAATALEKFRAGMAGIVRPERADVIGHQVGFDFSASEAVRNLSGSPEFENLAKAYMGSYVRALAQNKPTVMLLEDLHWADDSTLDLIEQMAEAIPQARLLLVALARPALFERRPHWGEAQPAFTRLELNLLSKRSSRALVDEILQKVDVVPDTLRDLIVEGAEGNPFYLEELVKMLLDEGVIERGRDEAGVWRVNRDRLHQVSVPPTLTGILQARLDSLPRAERETLQRAAVVGRLFWDAAVADLADVEREALSEVLGTIRSRELIFRRERSAFAGTHEYVFKHALLRDVTYETVLLKARRGYHAQVAYWLEAHAGERIGEYAVLIAEHLERAGQAEPAAAYLRRAVEKMLATGAVREALAFARRALGLLPAESGERAGLRVQAGEALVRLGDYNAACEALQAGLELAQRAGDEANCAAALDHLGWIATERGEWAPAGVYLEESLAVARRTGDRARTAHVLWNLGWLDIRQGKLAEAGACLSESRSLYEALADRLGVARALNGLGNVALARADYPEAGACFLEGLALTRRAGDRLNEAIALVSLGENARLCADNAAAWRYHREALDIFKEIGQNAHVALSAGNLGHVASALGDYATAVEYYREALRMTSDLQILPLTVDFLAGLAGVLARTGRPERALVLVAVSFHHPSLLNESRLVVEEVLADLRTRLSPQAVDAGLACGRDLKLEDVLAEVLAEGNTQPAGAHAGT